MVEKMKVGDIEILVQRKKIKNIYLSVSPLEGQVVVNVPRGTSEETIRLLIMKKINWLEKHIAKAKAQYKAAVLHYCANEVHYLWGKPYTMEIVSKKKRSLEINGNQLILGLRDIDSFIEKEKMMHDWYRIHLKEKLTILIDKWERIIGEKTNEVRIKNMRTRWGTCNVKAKRLWFNLQLAKKPKECLEYVVVHELVHLLAEKHDSLFYNYMDKFLPDWQQRKELLNRPNGQKGI